MHTVHLDSEPRIEGPLRSSFTKSERSRQESLHGGGSVKDSRECPKEGKRWSFQATSAESRTESGGEAHSPWVEILHHKVHIIIVTEVLERERCLQSGKQMLFSETAHERGLQLCSTWEYVECLKLLKREMPAGSSSDFAPNLSNAWH